MDKVERELDKSRKRPRSTSSENKAIDLSSTKKSKNPMGFPNPNNLSLRKAKMTIGRFFYENGLDFHVVNSPSFESMISFIVGPNKFEIPSCQELKGCIFQDLVEEMHQHVNEIRDSWAYTGCSILLDEWIDKQGRNLVNVLVDCPKGTIYLRSTNISDCIGNKEAMHLFLEKILPEVGINNVVQIMTCSTSAFMKEVGKEFMEKYRPIFWTFSASSCVELMLEKLCEIHLIKEILEKAKIITRFIHSHPDALKFVQDRTNCELVKHSKLQSMKSFLTLENIVLERETLRAMFHSSNASSSGLTSTAEGKRAAKVVADRSFWSDATMVLKGTIPLVRVIEWISTSKREQMGYIYERIEQVNETIKDEFKNKKLEYTQCRRVIDNVWNEFLYSPLLSAGYFFNLNLFYSEDIYIDPEVTAGVLRCIVRATENLDILDKITVQMEMYRKDARASFSKGCSADAKSDVSPGCTNFCIDSYPNLLKLFNMQTSVSAQWWHKYSVGCPELQRLAIRVLSQTCDGASKFQLKRSLAETVLSEGRNQDEQKRLSDAAFLQYNIQLQNFESGKTNYIVPETTEATDDWVTDTMHASTAQIATQ